MENDMSDNIQARWSEVKANFKKHFTNFSDAEVSALDGDYKMLAAAIERKYGYNKDRVKQELNNFMKAQSRDEKNNNRGDQQRASHRDEHGQARREDNYRDRH
jgi:uncharacterized protein YjbJ (UPF0337 family)